MAQNGDKQWVEVDDLDVPARRPGSVSVSHPVLMIGGSFGINARGLLNHELYVVCRRYCRCHQWTVLMATGLIIETSCLARICTEYCVKPIFSFIPVSISPAYMVSHKALVFCIGVHLYQAQVHTKNQVIKVIITNLWIFFIVSYK